MKKNEEKFLKNSISPNSRYSIIQKKECILYGHTLFRYTLLFI